MNIKEPLIVQRIPHILKNTMNKNLLTIIYFCLFTSQITRYGNFLFLLVLSGKQLSTMYFITIDFYFKQIN